MAWRYWQSCRQVAPGSILLPGFYDDVARGQQNQVGDTYTLVSFLFLSKATLQDPATPSCSGECMVLCALEDQQLQQVQLLSWKSMKIPLQSCSAVTLPCAFLHICI